MMSALPRLVVLYHVINWLNKIYLLASSVNVTLDLGKK
jgi:hypothetical protein